MGIIAIKLNPAKLENPDLDLRYLIPDRISALTGGKITDDGYDYIDDAMIIFMGSNTPKKDAIKVWEILKSETFLENDLSRSAIVAISENNDEEFDSFDVVHQP